MNMLINPMVETVSQGMHVLNHHIVHSKYITILFVNFTSIKLIKRECFDEANRKSSSQSHLLEGILESQKQTSLSIFAALSH